MKKSMVIAGILVAALSVAVAQAYLVPLMSPQPATTNMMMSGGYMNGSRNSGGSMMNGGHGGSMMGGYGNGCMMGCYGYGGMYGGYGNGGSMMGGGRSMNHQQWRWMIWHW
jgi:hypothetical protein